MILRGRTETEGLASEGVGGLVLRGICIGNGLSDSVFVGIVGNGSSGIVVGVAGFGIIGVSTTGWIGVVVSGVVVDGVPTHAVGLEVQDWMLVLMVNVLTLRTLLAFVAASVTVIVQSEYVPSARVLKVMVFDPDEAEVVALLHDPP